MSIPEIRPQTIALLNRMASAASSYREVGGGPVDLSWIDPLALGDLWTAAHETELWRGLRPAQTPAADAARAVLELGNKMEPAFRGSACRDYLALLVRKIEKEPDKSPKGRAIFTWEKACFALRRCVD